jgi:hypothetical protein
MSVGVVAGRSARAHNGLPVSLILGVSVTAAGVVYPDDSLIRGLCEANHISESEFCDWRGTSLAGATTALAARNGGYEPENQAGPSVH